MSRTRTKLLATGAPVPQSREEAAAAIARIGELDRELVRREAAMNDSLAKIKEAVEAAAQPLRAEHAGLTTGLQTWCEANRAVLTDGHRVKSADLGTGKVSWRLRPAKVTLPKDQGPLLELLRRLKLGRFIRTKEEVNREAMLLEPAVARTVAGVRIGSEGEDFAVEPFEAELSEAA